MSTFIVSNEGVSRTADLSLYSRSALAATQTAFRDHCKVHVMPVPANRISVTLVPHNNYSGETARLTLEFWNYFLDKALQEKLT
jgi:hypothetical protein